MADPFRLPSLPSLASSGGTYGFSGSSSSKGSYGFKPFKPPTSTTPSGPTDMQLLERYYLKQKNKPKSFTSKILHGGLHVVEKSLEVIERPAAAFAGGVYHGTEKGGFDLGKALSGARKGITGKEHIGFGQVLAEHGILKGHKTLRGVLGFGLDVATDPILLASLGTGVGEVGIALKAAEMGVAKKTLKSAVEKTLTGRFANAAEAKVSADLLKSAGKGFEARAKLARATHDEMRLFEAGAHDTKFGEAAASRLHGYQAMARYEHDFSGPRLISAQYKIPFGPMLAKQLPIKAPSLIRIADRKGILGHVPGLPNAMETVGKAFKPGWRNEKMHALEQMSLHLAEHRHDKMLKLVAAGLDKYAGKDSPLTQDEMLAALHFGETTKGIVKVRPGRHPRTLSKSVLDKAVKNGDISPAQAEFIANWHDVTEQLAKADREYGVKYDSPLLKGEKENILYVPHVRLQSGQKFNQGASVLAKRGFQYERDGGSQASIMQEIAHSPDLSKEVITNPLHLMARRTGAGATKQAEQFMVDTVASTFGHSLKIADQAKQIEHSNAMTALEGKMAGLHTLDQREYADLHHAAALATEGERHQALQAAGVKHMERELRIKKNIRNLNDRIRRAGARPKIPTAAQFLSMKTDEFDRLAKALSKRGAPEFAKGLKTARAKYKALTALERAVESSVRESLTLRPITGASAHGSNYKRLVGELIEKARPALSKGDWNVRKEFAQSPLKRGQSWEKRHDQLVEDLISDVKNERTKVRADLQAHLEKHLPSARKGRQNLEAHLAIQKQTLERHRAAWQPIEDKINQRSTARLQRRMDDLQALQERELVKGAAIAKALKRHERAIEHHATSKVNPLALQPGYRVVQRVKSPNGSPTALPHEMADALERSRDALSSDEFLTKFHNTWQKLVSQWKVGVTVVNPGYRVRNTLSDLWNAYISPKGGVPLWAMGVYGTKAADLTKDIIRAGHKAPSEWTADEKKSMRIFVEAYHHGILSGLFQGDVEKVRRYLEGTGSAAELTKSGHPLRGFTKVMTDFNRHAENWGRLMHYMYRREYQKMGPGEAARIVREAHFDYEDLTPAEQKIKRSLVPFYTWTRKNIPYQISAMAQRPGKYAAFPLLRNESEYASGNQPEGLTPNFIEQGLGFHVPFGGKGNFYLPPFGPTDVEKIQHPIGQGLGMLSPLLQVPIELAVNKNLSTGAPIYGKELVHPRAPVSGLAAGALSMIPGSNVGTTERMVAGKRISGPGANPILAYLASQTPLTNLAVNAESPIKKAQRGGGQKALLSEFGGISTYKPDQEQLQAAAQAQEQLSFKQYIRGLRDMGVLPEANKKHRSQAAKRNEQLASQAFG